MKPCKTTINFLHAYKKHYNIVFFLTFTHTPKLLYSKVFQKYWVYYYKISKTNLFCVYGAFQKQSRVKFAVEALKYN